MFAILPACVEGQTKHTVSGMLLDGNGAAVAFANCALLNDTDSGFVYGTLSGDSGAFVYVDVLSGHYLLRVSAVGYEPLWKKVDVTGDLDLGTLQLTAPRRSQPSR